MLRESGVPPMGFGSGYDRFSSDSDDSDDSDDSGDEDNSGNSEDENDSDESDSDSSSSEDSTDGPDTPLRICRVDDDSSSSDDSSEESDFPRRKRRFVDDRANDSSSDDSSEEEAEEWALWEKKIEKEQLAKAAAAAAAAKKSPDGPSEHPKTAQPPAESSRIKYDTTSASSTAEEESTEARNRGNDLYRKGLLDEATKAYFEALSLNPKDSAPLSNLSAVQFELGNYSGCSIYAEKALKLLNGEEDSNPKKQKLLSRLARAQILQLKDAARLVSELSPSDTAHNSATLKHGSRHESVTWTRLLD
jgi:tetratricopeptide (TPR) repeat protein